MILTTRSLAVLLATAAALVAQAARPGLAVERELVLRGGTAASLAWSHDSKWIASLGEAGDVLVIDAASGALVRDVPDQDRHVSALAFTPDDARLLLITPNGYAFAIDATTGRQIGDTVQAGLPLLPERVKTAAAGAPATVAPDGEQWAVARDGHLELRRGDELQRRVPLSHRSSPTAAAATADGKYVALAVARGDVSVFGGADGTAVTLPRALHGTPIDHRDGPELALLQERPGYDRRYPSLGLPSPPEWQRPGVVQLWSIDAMLAGRRGSIREFERPPTPTDDEATQVVSPDRTQRFSLESVFETHGDGSTTARLLDRDGEPRQTFAMAGFLASSAWSPSSRRFAVLAKDLHVFSVVATDEPIAIAGRWTAFAWRDAHHVLLADCTDNGTALVSRSVDDVATTQRIVLPGRCAVVDIQVVANGTRAILLRRNSALVVQLGE